ncbi:hypothetical protein [Vibrio parahaemolyticus]|uniref:hypothetical protein n=1 Tax=Vibrio parahaemolyticus TaxID=670 RepID=UPI0023611573|nr:hypothetical protein [Vibrio parahaemolyticus]MDQ2215692.1 hypothetical protein [Vibrio parahaemolyticus]HCM1219256.1 hypothetical protein [Vibrio parahaemolyticus]HCM1221400.1 hypothetical protein [Vibrio parahaemolyticus]
MTYKTYETQLDIAMNHSKSRRTLRKHFGKKSISYDDFTRLMARGGESIDAETSDLLGREKLWVDSGEPTIFIENKDLAQQLYLASFDVQDFNVEPPFKTFAMSFPKNTEIEGVKMHTALVSVMTVAEHLKANRDVLGMPQTLGCELETSDDLVVCVSANDGVHLMRGHSYLNTYEDPSVKHSESDEIDMLLKIALSLCVYHSATEGKKLEAGYPKSWVKKSKKRQGTNGRGMVLRGMGCGSKPSKEKSAGRKITLKVPFFRNLRAERYYQGEHKNKPIGSRWVFVKGIDLNNSQHSLLA